MHLHTLAAALTYNCTTTLLPYPLPSRTYIFENYCELQVCAQAQCGLNLRHLCRSPRCPATLELMPPENTHFMFGFLVYQHGQEGKLAETANSLI